MLRHDEDDPKAVAPNMSSRGTSCAKQDDIVRSRYPIMLDEEWCGDCDGTTNLFAPNSCNEQVFGGWQRQHKGQILTSTTPSYFVMPPAVT